MDATLGPAREVAPSLAVIRSQVPLEHPSAIHVLDVAAGDRESFYR